MDDTNFYLKETKVSIEDKLKITYAYPPYFKQETITETLTSLEIGRITLADKYPIDTENIISVTNLTAEEKTKSQYHDINSPKTLGDCMICPNCKSENTYQYDTDEHELEECSNKGHFFIDCHCKDCNKKFRAYVHFEYKITKAYTR